MASTQWQAPQACECQHRSEEPCRAGCFRSFYLLSGWMSIDNAASTVEVMGHRSCHFERRSGAHAAPMHSDHRSVSATRLPSGKAWLAMPCRPSCRKGANRDAADIRILALPNKARRHGYLAESLGDAGTHGAGANGSHGAGWPRFGLALDNPRPGVAPFLWQCNRLPAHAARTAFPIPHDAEHEVGGRGRTCEPIAWAASRRPFSRHRGSHDRASREASSVALSSVGTVGRARSGPPAARREARRGRSSGAARFRWPWPRRRVARAPGSAVGCPSDAGSHWAAPSCPSRSPTGSPS